MSYNAEAIVVFGLALTEEEKTFCETNLDEMNSDPSVGEFGLVCHGNFGADTWPICWGKVLATHDEDCSIPAEVSINFNFDIEKVIKEVKIFCEHFGFKYRSPKLYVVAHTC
jgi:hypothetical protein